LIMLLVRHPVDRVVSEYYHGLHNVRIEKYQFFLPWDHNSFYYDKDFVRKVYKDEITFIDYLKKGVYNPAHNRMTRIIAGYSPMVKEPFDSDFAYFLSHVAEDPVAQEIMFNQAVENIKKVTWVGVVEKMAQSFELLSFLLGWDFFVTSEIASRVPIIGRHTNRPEGLEISDEEREIILSENKWDLKLYEIALSMFQNQVTQMNRCKKIIEEYEVEWRDPRILNW